MSENDVNLNELITDQSKTINTLITTMQKSKTADTGQQQPIYFTSPTENVGSSEKPPNYALFIGLGFAFWFLVIKKGRL